MELLPREKDKLLLFTAGLVAERRKARGVKLNYPEVIAYISAAILEAARDGRTVAELMSYGSTLLTRDPLNLLAREARGASATQLDEGVVRERLRRLLRGVRGEQEEQRGRALGAAPRRGPLPFVPAAGSEHVRCLQIRARELRAAPQTSSCGSGQAARAASSERT